MKLAQIRKPSREGLLIAYYTHCIVLPPGPHKADELRALLDWYDHTRSRWIIFGPDGSVREINQREFVPNAF